MIRYIRFVFIVECHEWSTGTQLRLPYVVDYAATFAVNAALVTGQWQHHARIILLHPPVTEYEAGQTVSAVFQDIGM